MFLDDVHIDNITSHRTEAELVDALTGFGDNRAHDFGGSVYTGA